QPRLSVTVKQNQAEHRCRHNPCETYPAQRPLAQAAANQPWPYQVKLLFNRQAPYMKQVQRSKGSNGVIKWKNHVRAIKHQGQVRRTPVNMQKGRQHRCDQKEKVVQRKKSQNTAHIEITEEMRLASLLQQDTRDQIA